MTLTQLLAPIKERLERSKHKPWTDNIHELVTHAPTDIAKLLKVIEVLDLALQVYGMTNDSFPEYCNVAREARTRAAEILK